ncbi:MAG TPA: hypothetical protein DCF63_01345, partial [Planctomycetaceae bacterium]|nr:hypothetical protein [Planctomycetaceae bacterium]
MSDSAQLPDYELPASFYLGKKYQLNGRQLLEDKVLYDAKDLTTHAMCVGMTGTLASDAVLCAGGGGAAAGVGGTTDTG